MCVFDAVSPVTVAASLPSTPPIPHPPRPILYPTLSPEPRAAQLPEEATRRARPQVARRAATGRLAGQGVLRGGSSQCRAAAGRSPLGSRSSLQTYSISPHHLHGAASGPTATPNSSPLALALPARQHRVALTEGVEDDEIRPEDAPQIVVLKKGDLTREQVDAALASGKRLLCSLRSFLTCC